MDNNLLTTPKTTHTHTGARSNYTEVRELSWVIVADDCTLFSFIAFRVRKVCAKDD